MRVYEATIVYKIVEQGPKQAVSSADRVAEYLRSAFDSHPTQESVYVILLNRKNMPLGRVHITLGTATNSLIHPREVFRPAILGSASAIIVAHNHPSGDPTPSSADIQVTRQLREAAKAVCIDLLDHVIVGDIASDPAGLGYYSFRNAGLI